MEVILEMTIPINFRIEYEQILFIKLPIDRLTNNIVERLKVSLTEQ